MPSCSAVNCSNRSEKGFILKVFPRDPVRRALWALKVRRRDWEPNGNSYLCEAHFAADQWEKVRVDGKRKLKHNAVPTIFSHTQNIPCEEPQPVEQNILEDIESMSTVEKHSVGFVTDGQNLDKEIDDPNIVINDLKKKLLCAESCIEELKHHNLVLKLKLKQKSLKLDRLKRKHHKKRHRENFNEVQVNAMQQKSMVYTKWSDETIRDALSLRFSCGGKGYEDLLDLE